MFSKKHRLNTREFEHTLAKGHVHRGRFFYVRITKNNLGIVRVGVAVSKKIAKAPTKKNYYKRVLRHVVHEAIGNLNLGFDIIIIGNEDIKNRKFEDLREDAIQLFKKTNIF